MLVVAVWVVGVRVLGVWVVGVWVVGVWGMRHHLLVYVAIRCFFFTSSRTANFGRTEATLFYIR